MERIFRPHNGSLETQDGSLLRDRLLHDAIHGAYGALEGKECDHRERHRWQEHHPHAEDEPISQGTASEVRRLHQEQPPRDRWARASGCGLVKYSGDYTSWSPIGQAFARW